MRAEAVDDCPCTQLGVALGYRRNAAARTRSIEVLMDACERGSYVACDAFELARALCLRTPEGPECSVLRQHGWIPRRLYPLEDILGCHRVADRTLCLQRDRVFSSDSRGTWDQELVLRYSREDETREPRWVMELRNARVLVSPAGVVGEEPNWNVAAGWTVRWKGRWRRLSPAENDAAMRAIRSLPRVEEACARARACVNAIEAARRSGEAARRSGEGEGEIESESDEPYINLEPESLPSLRVCQAIQRRALRKLAGARPPSACTK